MSALDRLRGGRVRVSSLFAGVVAGIPPYPTIFLILAALNLPALPSILSIREEKRK